MAPPVIQAVRRWIGTRVRTYVVLMTALGLNLPLYAAALARQLEGVPLLSIAGLYAGFVIIGYYGLLLFVLLTLVFVLTGFSRRLALIAGVGFLLAAACYLVVDSIIHRAFRFHVDAFWVHYVLTSFRGIGIPPSTLALAFAGLLVLVAIEFGIFALARRMRPHRLATPALVAVMIGCFVVSQVMHIVAYYKSDARITSITPQLPFYSPVVSQGHAARYGDLVALGMGEAETAPASASMHYPLRAVRPAAKAPRPNVLLLLLESWRFDVMDSTVSPNIGALARRSSVFRNHLSSGNATPHGVFGLFYGIHPTYWAAVKANNAAIDNPVLIDVLGGLGYSFGIFADSQFGRHKIKDAMFRGIPVHETFAGRSPDARDDDMTTQLIEYIDAEHRARRPFFGFAFYKSTHYSYTYPAGTGPFQPARELNIATVGNEPDPSAYLNDYRNSVYYTDSLIGRILRHLESTGLMDETIVIVTSDHGEEFNDNHAGWWGHTGNFTRFQSQVPLVFHLPGRAPRRVDQMTAHIDVPTTLLEEVYGCGPPHDYSNGENLFALPAGPRAFVVGGYVNHAFVMGEDVHTVYPMFVQNYRLGDIHGRCGPPDPRLARRLMEETHRFYPSGSPHAPSGTQRASVIGR